MLLNDSFIFTCLNDVSNAKVSCEGFEVLKMSGFSSKFGGRDAKDSIPFCTR